ncbi:MAG: DUF1667 domain-containing protein [Bacillota bacterium]|nr:DUF1667 domain-containing protein [Bacillota bacterium]
MMDRTEEVTCILCPNGCAVTVSSRQDPLSGAWLPTAVSGNLCGRGEAYAKQELTAPRRTLTSSVAVDGGALPLASVRLTKAVPRERLPEIMEEIRRMRVSAPVRMGQTLAENVRGLGADLICTRNVEKKPAQD